MNQLRPRTPALHQSPWAVPTVSALADAVPHPAGPAARRWAVQVLAGPAATYRQLGTTALAALPPNSTLYNTGAAASATARERPTLGFGAEVQLRRVLNGRWAVSAGLGYHEYATILNSNNLPVTTRTNYPYGTGPTIADSTAAARSFRLRDTYRFLTIPVRFSYQLGAGGPRLRFGVLAGADAAWYLGGATAEGSACGCETRTWGPTDSPYRPLSLALSLGLDVRYRLAPRWELLAQPTATYFLTSLARPALGFVPRHLLGGGALLGVSYELR